MCGAQLFHAELAGNNLLRRTMTGIASLSTLIKQYIQEDSTAFSYQKSPASTCESYGLSQGH